MRSYNIANGNWKKRGKMPSELASSSDKFTGLTLYEYKIAATQPQYLV